MARLQLPSQQQIAPGQLPGVRADAPQSQGAEITARQSQELGGAINQAGQQAARIMTDVLERANALRVNEAMNQARRTALNLEYGEGGFRGLRGEQAMPDAFEGRPMTQVFGERFDQAVSEIDSSLGNSAQRAAFRAQAAQLGMSLRQQAQAHEFAEFERYGASILDGGIVLAGEEAATAFATPDRVAASIAQIGVLGNERMQVYNGLSANERAARVQVLQSNAVVGVIRAAADAGDLSLARGYAERYDSVLTAEAKLQVGALITPAMDAELARSIVSDIFSGRDAPPQAGAGEPVRLDAPVQGPTSSAFGPRAAPTTRNGRGSSDHGGTDYAVPVGTPVRAAGRGVVTFAGERGGYGNLVIVEHADGRETYYAHLSDLNVREGQEVDSGAEIARSGDTGNVSGAHLHFEVRVNGQPVNPATQLGERNAGAAQRAAGEPARRGPPQTRQEAEERALAALGERATPEQVRAARQEVDRAWTLRQQAREQAEATAVQQAQEWLVANDGDFNAMPPSIRSAIPAQYMDNVIAFGRAVARPSEVTETPPEVYYLLQDDRELLGLSDAEFLAMRDHVRREDWQSAARRRQDLRTPDRPTGNAADPNLLPRARMNAIMNPLLTDMGLPPGGGSTGRQNTERRRRIGAIQQFVDGVVLDAQRSAGRQLYDTELRPLLQRLFTEQDVLERGFFGGRRESNALSFSARHIRGSQYWPDIKAHFDGAGISNPTDSQIETAYYRRMMGLPLQ